MVNVYNCVVYIIEFNINKLYGIIIIFIFYEGRLNIIFIGYINEFYYVLIILF